VQFIDFATSLENFPTGVAGDVRFVPEADIGNVRLRHPSILAQYLFSEALISVRTWWVDFA